MSRAFYSPDVTRFSQQVMEGIRGIDRETKGVSLLGGWAVHALVDEAHRMESRDIDVVIHNEDAWSRFEPWLASMGYRWRTFGKREKDNAFLHERHEDVRVDFFFGRGVPDGVPRRLFNTRWVAALKDVPYEGFVPGLGTVLRDKLETLPKRPDSAKALKDALDAGSLLFHNLAGAPPRALMSEAADAAARRALPRVRSLRAEHARYATELEDLASFLERRLDERAPARPGVPPRRAP